MKILILGAGKMGSFFNDVLSFDHETAVYDTNPQQLRFVYNTYRFTTLDEIKEFQPELLINAVTVKYTLQAFREVLPYLPKDCIISDIASVKTGLKRFYKESGFRFVSTHPMYFPFYVCTNETKNGWMDEGFTVFLPEKIQTVLSPGFDEAKHTTASFEKYAGMEDEPALITSSFYLDSRIYFYLNYGKAEQALRMLETELGTDVFQKCLFTFMDSWKYKHPTPIDFFNTFNTVSKQNLNWFWNAWYYQNGGIPDMAIKEVNRNHAVYEGGYCPVDLTFDERTAMLHQDPEHFCKLVDKSLRRHFDVIKQLVAKGTYFFDYGNSFMLYLWDIVAYRLSLCSASSTSSIMIYYLSFMIAVLSVRREILLLWRIFFYR